MRDDDELQLEAVELVCRIVVQHVLQHLRELARIAEGTMIEAGDVGVLLQLAEVEQGWVRALAAAANTTPEAVNAPSNSRRLLNMA